MPRRTHPKYAKRIAPSVMPYLSKPKSTWTNCVLGGATVKDTLERRRNRADARLRR